MYVHDYISIYIFTVLTLNEENVNEKKKGMMKEMKSSKIFLKRMRKKKTFLKRTLKKRK